MESERAQPGKSEGEYAEQYKAEGRIEIAAPAVQNSHGAWFLPGAGKTVWFKDIEAGPEMVVVPAGSFMMGSRQCLGMVRGLLERYI